MPSIYTIMDISRWPLQASSRQLDVVSHNVANVKHGRVFPARKRCRPPAYRKRPPKAITAGDPSWWMWCKKVDKLILERLTDKEGDQSYYDARLTQLKRLEALSNEAGEPGLGRADHRVFQRLAGGGQHPRIQRHPPEPSGPGG